VTWLIEFPDCQCIGGDKLLLILDYNQAWCMVCIYGAITFTHNQIDLNKIMHKLQPMLSVNYRSIIIFLILRTIKDLLLRLADKIGSTLKITTNARGIIA